MCVCVFGLARSTSFTDFVENAWQQWQATNPRNDQCTLPLSGAGQKFKKGNIACVNGMPGKFEAREQSGKMRIRLEATGLRVPADPHQVVSFDSEEGQLAMAIRQSVAQVIRYFACIWQTKSVIFRH